MRRPYAIALRLARHPGFCCCCFCLARPDALRVKRVLRIARRWSQRRLRASRRL